MMVQKVNAYLKLSFIGSTETNTRDLEILVV